MRRDIHQHPEIAIRRPGRGSRVHHLRNIGREVRRRGGMASWQPQGRKARPHRCVAGGHGRIPSGPEDSVRLEGEAAVQGKEVPVMHACGHDGQREDDGVAELLMGKGGVPGRCCSISTVRKDQAQPAGVREKLGASGSRGHGAFRSKAGLVFACSQPERWAKIYFARRPPRPAGRPGDRVTAKQGQGGCRGARSIRSPVGSVSGLATW